MTSKMQDLYQSGLNEETACEVGMEPICGSFQILRMISEIPILVVIVWISSNEDLILKQCV